MYTMAMSLLKEHYSKITFPFHRKNPGTVFRAYRQEFGFDEKLDLRKILILFANALHDYLEDRLDDHAFGSFSFALYTAPGVIKILEQEYHHLTSPLSDCVDISWLAGSPYFTAFRYELMAELETLKVFYAENFED